MLASKNKINATGFVIYQHLHLGGHKKEISFTLFWKTLPIKEAYMWHTVSEDVCGCFLPTSFVA
mgnify:CR=1 FL=1